ncbi:MAG: hypothetical protein JWL76_200 [Thermoleophilia bacterium]|nr:hypothetical protein [Thermoleophilia bacterium]
MPGGTTPAVVPVPADQSAENVVYLGEEHGIPADRGAIAPNPRAGEYDTPAQQLAEPPQAPQPDPVGPAVTPMPPPTPIRPPEAEPVYNEIEALRQRAAELEAALPAFGSHGPIPQQHELVPPPRVDDNPFGDFFGDGASAWLEDDDDDDSPEITQPRVVGTMLAAGAVAMLLAAWAVWGHAMYRGAGGAEAGGFLLLSMLLWIWYLSMPREQQHTWMLKRHVRVQKLVERRVSPIKKRTEGHVTMRSERGRYRAMRDERTRRVNALGEGAYRSFRQGTLQPDLHAGAQRVLAMERQMLVQDQRIHGLMQERLADRNQGGDGGGHAGHDPASGMPEDGHPAP